MQEAPRCLKKHFWCRNSIPDWKSQAAEWQNPPFTQHLLHLFSLPFNYLLSWPHICSLMLVQKVFSTCSLNHFLFQCVQLGGGFCLSFGHDFCLDPSPGSSSAQMTQVAILKCFDNFFLISNAAVPNPYCLELLFVRVWFWTPKVGVELNLALVAMTSPCLLGNLNWWGFFGFWALGQEKSSIEPARCDLRMLIVQYK